MCQHSRNELENQSVKFKSLYRIRHHSIYSQIHKNYDQKVLIKSQRSNYPGNTAFNRNINFINFELLFMFLNNWLIDFCRSVVQFKFFSIEHSVWRQAMKKSVVKTKGFLESWIFSRGMKCKNDYHGNNTIKKIISFSLTFFSLVWRESHLIYIIVF